MTAIGERAEDMRRDCVLSFPVFPSHFSLSLARRTPTSLLARAAGKTRGKSTTGGTNILGVLTSQGGDNVSEEEGERVRVYARARARARALHK